MRKIAIVAGTRPEIIKLAPVYLALKSQARKSQSQTEPVWITTGQHQELAAQALAPFQIKPDVTLQAMTPGQSLNSLLSRLIESLSASFESLAPAQVVVQGDTTSALAATLAAFQQQIPVAHVEAGLRTYNLQSPFPEEANRQLISRLATLHFCPTERAARNLANEGITAGVHVSGNTIVDALEYMKALLINVPTSVDPLLSGIIKQDPFVLVTAHRRENFDDKLAYLCDSLLAALSQVPNLHIVLPVHLNPNVRGPVQQKLSQHPRLHLLEPVDYPSLLRLMDKAALIVTDSGGLQEEAPSFGKYVIVTRDTTERPELIDAGMGELCPLDSVHGLEKRIVACLARLKTTPTANPFGDGKSGMRIAARLG